MGAEAWIRQRVPMPVLSEAVEGKGVMIPTDPPKRYLSPEEQLLYHLLASNIRDYLKGMDSQGNPSTMPSRSAKRWIFHGGKESALYVTGFEFICTYFNLDPDRMRKKLAEIATKEQAQAILSLAVKRGNVI